MDAQLLYSHARRQLALGHASKQRRLPEEANLSRLQHVALKDISKFQVQMLLNQLAAAGYSYNVAYHVRDIIKAALAEALERNVARKTVIPEIEERDKPILPVEWHAKLLASLESSRDLAIFLIASFCALSPSEIFGLTWGSLPRLDI